jgi:hypothetical protein
MTQRKGFILTGVLGLLSLLASGITFVLIQVCFVQSFWLHALVAPLNPRTIFQPTSLTYLGDACQLLFGVLLPGGVAFLVASAYFFFRGRQASRRAG